MPIEEIHLPDPHPWTALQRGEWPDLELGVMHRDAGLIVFLMNLFDMPKIESMDELMAIEHIRYETHEELFADGWMLG